MTTATTDNRLEKIRALLAKAESTNHPEEAKSFTAKAQELMTKWAIDEAQLAGLKDAKDIKAVWIDFPMEYSPFQGPREQLLGNIARAQGVRVIYESGKVYWEDEPDAKGNRVRIVNAKGKPSFRRTSKALLCGLPHALEFTQALYTSCLLQAEIEFRSEQVQAQMAADCAMPGHRTRWRNSWTTGYAIGVRDRLQAAKQTVVDASAPGTALVLIDQSKLADDAVADRFPRLGHKRSGQELHGGALAGGKAAAQKADLGQPRAGTGRKAALTS